MAGKYGRKYAKINEELEEGEVLWGGVNNNEGKKDMFNNNSCPKHHFTTSSSSPTHFFTAPKMIPKSSSSEIFTVRGNKNSSAPLDIPDWSKIYGKKTSKKKKNFTTSSYTNYNNSTNIINSNNYNNNNDGYYNNGYNDCNGYDNGYCNNDDDDDDNDDDMDGMVPPHEYIARKLARSQISSFSVYEGIGRTLKGRDLSKVRNTILSKTGFLE